MSTVKQKDRLRYHYLTHDHSQAERQASLQLFNPCPQSSRKTGFATISHSQLSDKYAGLATITGQLPTVRYKAERQASLRLFNTCPRPGTREIDRLPYYYWTHADKQVPGFKTGIATIIFTLADSQVPGRNYCFATIIYPMPTGRYQADRQASL